MGQPMRRKGGERRREMLREMLRKMLREMLRKMLRKMLREMRRSVGAKRERAKQKKSGPPRGSPSMGEEKPDEELMGKRKSSPRFSRHLSTPLST